MSRLSAFLAAALFALAPVQGRSETPDDAFIKVYRLIQDADHLRQAGQSDLALAKYTAAEEGLKRLQSTYPQWNEKIVRFRLGYIAEKAGPLKSLRPSAPTRSTSATIAEVPVTPLPTPATNPQSEAEIRSLRDQVQQLQADRALLDARLKEALTAQPAAADPKELERARSTVRSLEKERELLRVALEREKTTGTERAQTEAENARKALELANIRLAEQDRAIERLRKRANTPQDQAELTKAKERGALLATENELLKKRVQELQKPGEFVKSEIEKLRRELAEARTELTAQKADYEKLLLENRQLSKDLTSARASVRESELATRRTELELESVRNRLAKDASATNNLGAFGRMRLRNLEKDRDRLERELAAGRETARKSQAAIAAMESEKASLQKKIEEAGAVLPARQEEAQRVKELERERDELKRQLKEASKKNSAQRRSTNKQPQKDAEKELASLRAKVGAFEAQKVPYTADEIALFRRPESGPQPGPAATRPAAAQEPASNPAEPVGRRSLPPAAASLVMEAKRAFSARRFSEAETLYRDVLKMDEKNVFTLANLGAILAEQSRLSEAEAMLQRALKEDFKDAFSLSLMGRVKFQQNKFDDALENLSLAAQADPKNPETQNYLGITLSQKGQRGPAEVALREAIRLSPNYASAHHNLAIIYATQTPPFIELARWHYEKAVSSGHARNSELEARFEVSRTASTTTR